MDHLFMHCCKDGVRLEAEVPDDGVGLDEPRQTGLLEALLGKQLLLFVMGQQDVLLDEFVLGDVDEDLLLAEIVE
jgi:hypothetical protein